jgi:hypothetical protein
LKRQPLYHGYLGLAACNVRLQSWREALLAAQTASRIHPQKADAWGLASVSMLNLGFMDSAETTFNLFLDRLAQGVGANFISSWLLIEMGFDWTRIKPGVIGGGKAEACALQALRVAGPSPKVHWLLGESMVVSKMAERGVMEMLTAVQAFSKSDDEDSRIQRERVLNRCIDLAVEIGENKLIESVRTTINKNVPYMLPKLNSAIAHRKS